MRLTQDTINGFSTKLVRSGRSANTAKAYTSDLKVFMLWADERGSEVNAESFNDLAQDWLTETRKDAAPKTTRRRLTSLKGVAKFAGFPNDLDEYIAPTPARAVAHPISGGTDVLLAMLRAARKPEHRALVALQGFGGLRVSEALAVRPADVDARNGLITVWGKGSKVRHVPFEVGGEAFAAILAQMENVSDPSDTIVGLPDRTARYTITALAKKVGIEERVASHDLRMTAGTGVFERSGYNIRVAQEFLGHASIQQTQVYTEVTMDSIRKAVSLNGGE